MVPVGTFKVVLWINIGFPLVFLAANEKCSDQDPWVRSNLELDVVLA